MKLNTSPRVGNNADLARELKDHAAQVNALAEGRIFGTYNAQAAVPTTGTYAVGDFIRNSAPAEAGSASSKYVIVGWVYTAAGFVQCRFLTGN